MQKKSLLTGGVIALSAAMVFAGCQQLQQPQQTPEEVVQMGLKNLTAVTSHQFEFGVKGDMTGPQGETPQKVKFDVTLGGSVDLKNSQDPKINLKLDGSGSADAQSGSGSAEFRMNKDALYFMLSKIDTQGGEAIPKQFTDQYVGKWWTIAIPPDTFKELTNSLPEGGTQQGATSQEIQLKEKMKTLFENTKFFKNITFVGMEDIKGMSSSHYTADFDKDAFMQFAQEAAVEQGTPMTDSDKKDMQDAMKKVDISGNLWIAKDAGIVDQVSGDIKFASGLATDPTGTVSVRVTLWGFNQPVTVEVPTGAQEFPIQELMGAMMGGAPTGADTTSLDQSSMMNEYATQQIPTSDSGTVNYGQ